MVILAVFLLAITFACARPSPDATVVPAATSTPVGQAAQVTPTPTPAGSGVSPTATIAAVLAPSPTAAPQPGPAATSTPRTRPPSLGAPIMPDIVPEPPERDLYELALRVHPIPEGPVPRIVNPEPVSYQEGHTDTFWVANLVDGTTHTVQATLRLVSEHAYWYVDDTLDISLDDLRQAAEAFESNIHPTITGNIGDIWNPGVDNDPHLVILHTPLQAAAGYFGSQDEYPRAVHPHSNQREIIYMDGRRMRPGSVSYLGVLAHEFQHAVHWNLDAGEDAWLNEGMSEVAREMAGYRSELVPAFLRRPETQLNFWPDDPSQSAPHYAAATLFLTYLAEHYGGYQRLKELVADPLDGVNSVERYLAPYGKSFRDVFKDWVVANYLDEQDGPYSYPGRDVRVLNRDLMFDYGERSGVVPQFGTRYIDLRLREGDATVTFHGDTQVPQVGARCRSGSFCWWGNRGDSIDSTLTQEFDLSGLSAATLEFWTWYSIEKDWDYAYVMASTDGGATWHTLQGQHTTRTNPIGNNLGDGITGQSGGWVQERIDLTPFAGSTVLLRFEYVTDDAVYRDGFMIDDITIPELGFFDDAESAGAWQSAGFARIDTILPQEYAVQIIEVSPDGRAAVRELRLDGSQSGETAINGFGSDIERAAIAISPVTRGTSHPASYTLTVSSPR